ncbi:MAG TPA: methyltransferase domain-containing protein [Longimicrobiales bacterium]
MTVAEALDLIGAGAGRAEGQLWADLGAGEGTFSRALAELVGARGRVIAVERDARAVRELRALRLSARIDVVAGDIRELNAIAALQDIQLDGALFANVLHFIEDPAGVLLQLRRYMKPGSAVLVVEYDRRGASRWVPYPLPVAQLQVLTRAVGLTAPVVVGRRKSRYQGELYCARMQW